MTKFFQSFALRWRYFQLKWDVKPDFLPFFYAMKGYEKLKSDLWNPKYLTIVDLTKSNTQKRFFVLNMEKNRVEFAVQTWHGKKSWGEFATLFSNEIGSNQTSLWFNRTPLEIQKARTKDRRGLLLNGIEASNDNARKRGIFIHPAGIDQSEGCFTLPELDAPILNMIKGDSLLFAYYPDQEYLLNSELLQ